MKSAVLDKATGSPGRSECSVQRARRQHRGMHPDNEIAWQRSTQHDEKVFTQDAAEVRTWYSAVAEDRATGWSLQQPLALQQLTTNKVRWTR